MTIEKVTVSIPKETLAQARGAIRRGRARSLSAYFASAVQQKVKDDDLVAMLDEMLESTGGPLTPAEDREAERVLGLAAPRRRKQ